MLVKFFNRGVGGGKGPIDYLLGKDWSNDKLRKGATLLAGNPLLTQELINSTPYARKYTAGCLSFEEDPALFDDIKKQAIMAAFEKTLFPGLDPSEYNILWVEHTDKTERKVKNRSKNTGARLELNFLIPNMTMSDNKRLQPYYYAADFKRVNAWQNIVNHELMLSDPHDPKKRRLFNPYVSRNMPLIKDIKKTKGKNLTDNAVKVITHSEEKQRIYDELEQLYRQDKIHSRQDVIDLLPSLGATSIKPTASAISIKVPGVDKNIRLKGPLFDERFVMNDIEKAYAPKAKPKLDSDGNIVAADPIRKIVIDGKDNMAEIYKIYQTGMEIKRQYHIDRYSPPPTAPATPTAPVTPQPPTQSPQQQPTAPMRPRM